MLDLVSDVGGVLRVHRGFMQVLDCCKYCHCLITSEYQERAVFS